MVGKTVQQYQFLEKLGSGGMGEIYKAQDTRLNRFVAIKVLTTASAGDPDRRRRFMQEAQAASALNHPNIITIHDVLSEGNSNYMVMEFVQGKTLADLIPKGGLRVPFLLKLGLQMTDALAAAHAAGIIHRDLKPGNVMVTESGLVKILDFGLAKLTDRAPLSQAAAPGDVTQTIAQQPLTIEGSIIGTVSYMSPEQAQGHKVDTRSDIFSLGVVLYEMVTGTRAFTGDSALSTLSAILRDEARPIPEIVPDTPPQLEALIARCLRKNPDERFQTMRDVQAAMAALKHDSDSGLLYRAPMSTLQEAARPAQGKEGPPPAKAASRTPLIAAAGVVALLLIGGGVWLATRSAAPEPPQPVAETAKPGNDVTLNNDSIIEMVTARVPAEVVLSQIRSSPSNFDLSPQGVIRLSQAGVPPILIEAMRNPAGIPEIPVPPPEAAPPPPGKDAKKPGKDQPAARASLRPPPKDDKQPKGDKSKAVLTAEKGKAPETQDKEEFNRRLQEILRPKEPPPAPEPPSTPPPQAAPAEDPAPPPPAPVTRVVTARDGQPFTVVLAADIPNDAAAGSQLRFTVKDDVRAEGGAGPVVIARGAVVTGQIVQAARRRIIGSSKATMKLLTVQAVDGKTYKVRALSARTGKGDPERSVETTLKPKSDDVAAPAGAEYIAYLDGDAQITVRQ
jgi:hypothetical protein